MAKKQEKVDADPQNVTDIWKSFTRLKAYRSLTASLAVPLGDRKRCAYCSDSRAAAVEHFRPKSTYPSHAFQFENMLLICDECNRRKLASFPLDGAGIPQLVNPYYDDPWDVFSFAPTTGYLGARITAVNENGPVEDPRGAATLKVLGQILNSEPLLKGRRSNWRRLIRRLNEVLSGESGMPHDRSSLWDEDDDFGLGDFILDREGKELPDVLPTRLASPAAWGQVRALPR